MKLHSLKIKGFRKLNNIEVKFGDATFLIGQNNCGKSSILKVIEILLSAKKQLDKFDYHSIIDEDTGETKPNITEITLEAEFQNLPEESRDWRGFKGRIFEYTPKVDNDTGLSITYRKTYKIGEDVIIELKQKKRDINERFKNCKTGKDYIEAGIDEEIIKEYFPNTDKSIGKTKADLEALASLDDIYDVTEEEEWFQNPGGIPGNILKMLPRFLLIPVDTSSDEIQGNSSGVLGKTLTELFETVRGGSQNYIEAQKYLNLLAEELDPEDIKSQFGKMMGELNSVLSSVFPESRLHANTTLSEPSSLKPSFKVEMSSNVKTSIENQGTGMIRAAVFGMLRFRQRWLSQREDEHNRSLIICFEEPEIYLHPSAANQMRDTIYELSTTNSQIIASTHSPFLIDISRKPRQVLNRLMDDEDGQEVKCDSFSVSEKFIELQDDNKDYVKMLLKIDSHIARVFFTNHVVIIEGDTEDILIKESLSRLPREDYLRIVSNFEIVKARGKATIIGFVKYLVLMGINPIVVHDRDGNTPGAEIFNQPIINALAGNGRIVLMEEEVEDEVGYTPRANDKPFHAYKETLNWGDRWEDIPEKWRKKMEEIFFTDTKQIDA